MEIISVDLKNHLLKIWKMIYAQFFCKLFSKNAHLTSPLLLYLSHNNPPGAFSRIQPNTKKKKKSFSLKSFAFENILYCKIFYRETNGA
jgi:hypothetical protein